MNLSSDTTLNQTKPSLCSGASIVACVCIGAGMLGLPTAGAGSWTIWSSLTLIVTMLIMTASGCLLLESFKSYPFRSSFSTVTRDLLGPRIATVNNLAVYFVGAILLYAYTTSSGLIIEQYTSVNASTGSIFFVLLFSAFVWHSTQAVSKISIVLLLFMSFSFIFSILGLLTSLDPINLFGDFQMSNSVYVFSLLPIALTSFGFHHTVSSLRDYYVDEFRAEKAMVLGTGLALFVYLIWQISVYGNLTRSSFIEVRELGGNVDALMSLMTNGLKKETLSTILNAFSSAAILSSFIGVGLGVFDFLTDAFQFENNRSGRFKAWLVTFLPPLLFSYFLPFGFLATIGYASLFAAIWACIIPALLVKKVREEESNNTLEPCSTSWKPSSYTTPGGDLTLIAVFLFGIIIIVIRILEPLGFVPNFGR
ncbi:transposase [Vibrio aquaticus]|uniref:Aromatic amino acid permease n=1 Tax=Vibrio aquaticus TaxID=2496559 RepID=A0A432D1Y8_9VIBR|nr:aromatic amino acid transporter [Vibrio aquaticus]RTZ17897.1 transposase [Vibrio aquaticus]